jgi:hypothetical protein
MHLMALTLVDIIVIIVMVSSVGATLRMFKIGGGVSCIFYCFHFNYYYNLSARDTYTNSRAHT